MRVIIALLVYTCVCCILSLVRPLSFFNIHTGMPYSFGLSSENSRPYSLHAVFTACAVVIYFVLAMMTP